MQFIFMMPKLNFQSLQSSVSHDPSEIILICWFNAKEIFPIIIKIKNSHFA